MSVICIGDQICMQRKLPSDPVFESRFFFWEKMLQKNFVKICKTHRISHDVFVRVEQTTILRKIPCSLVNKEQDIFEIHM